MFYLVFAVVMAAVIIAILAIRHRPSTDPAKSVSSFQRAIKALDEGKAVKTKARAGRL